jgi:hypothetical protein
MPKTYHATVYTNDRAHRMVNSVGVELTKDVAVRIVRDLNTVLALLGVNAYAELVEEEN